MASTLRDREAELRERLRRELAGNVPMGRGVLAPLPEPTYVAPPPGALTPVAENQVVAPIPARKPAGLGVLAAGGDVAAEAAPGVDPETEEREGGILQSIHSTLTRPGVGQGLLQLSGAMLGGQGNFEQRLGQGLPLLGEEIAQGDIRAQEEATRAAREEVLKRRAAAESIIRLSPDVAYNADTGEFITTPEETLKRLTEAGRRSTRMQQGTELVDAEGNLVFQMFDPQKGPMLLVDGKWQRAADVDAEALGLKRAQDSLEKPLARQEGKEYGRILESATGAALAQAQARYALDIIEQNEELYFGPGADALLAANNLFVAFGGDPERAANVADAETLRSMALNQAMQFVGQTKGAISEKEMELFMAASPALQRSREGNIRLLSMAEAVAARARERARFFEQNVRRRGYAATAQAWDDYINEPENYIFRDVPGARPGGGLNDRGASGLTEEDEDLLRKYE